MRQTLDLCRELPVFFDQWCVYSRFTPLEDKLPAFFDELKKVLPAARVRPTPRTEPGETLDKNALGTFLVELEPLLVSAKHAGFLCDPWAVASLKRNEVRKSAVLAWWLDPWGSHGLGPALLTELLHFMHWDCSIDRSCSVRVESHPDGDRSNRVDIEIDAPGFFLIIEVKIDAPEGIKQLQRYCNLAEMKKTVEKRGVLFLTPTGRPPVSVDPNSTCEILPSDQVIPISWKKIASLLQAALRQHHARFQTKSYPETALVELLARTFCNHIKQL